MPDNNSTEQRITSIDFSTLNDVPQPNQANEFVIHVPTAFASSPMVPPDYQVTAWFPRQPLPRIDSTRH